MKLKKVIEPEEWIEPGEFYCPDCGGSVGCLCNGTYKCIESNGILIGCGWCGKDDGSMPVKNDALLLVYDEIEDLSGCPHCGYGLLKLEDGEIYCFDLGNATAEETASKLAHRGIIKIKPVTHIDVCKVANRESWIRFLMCLGLAFFTVITFVVYILLG